jgi:iron-sulfur cluster repair protein YtfE (RIC family)
VFAAFGVDACCGGDRTVAGAAREDGVNLTALLLALELAAEGGCDGPACACPCAAPCRSAAR